MYKKLFILISAIFLSSSYASAKMCNVSNAHLEKTKAHLQAMRGEAAKNKIKPGKCGINKILSQFKSDFNNPNICGPETIRQTCVKNIQNAIVNNQSKLPKSGGCDTLRQGVAQMSSRANNMKQVSDACEKRFIASRESCRAMYRQTFGKVGTCSPQEIDQASKVMMKVTVPALELYCQVIENHVKGRVAQAKVEKVSEQLSQSVAQCDQQ